MRERRLDKIFHKFFLNGWTDEWSVFIQKKRGKWRRPAVELHNINFLFTYDITPSLLFNAVVPLHTVAIQFGRKQV